VELAQSMAQRLRHRGPDGEGVWCEPGVALAHRRLAILDLSECGHQPMLFDSQVLTYNGEIYNHERLRAGMPGPWQSTGDTEVLVHLLAKQGQACLDRLVGMFAFAAWDTREQRLLLARDRLGIKPLYYQLLPDGIAFASELKALLVLGQPEIDQSAVRDFLFHGYIPAPKTIYRGIARGPQAASASSAIGIRRPPSSSAAPAIPCGSSMSCCAMSCRNTPCRMCRSAFS
jgi:asparagine synthase (glutamine-hydrolysing)